VRNVVGDRGSAGGHGEMAGARLDVSRLTPAESEQLVDRLFEEFCVELGVADEPREPLVPPAPSGGSGTEEPDA